MTNYICVRCGIKVSHANVITPPPDKLCDDCWVKDGEEKYEFRVKWKDKHIQDLENENSTLRKQVEELKEGLKYAIKELDASGLWYDHPIITKPIQLIGKEGKDE